MQNVDYPLLLVEAFIIYQCLFSMVYLMSFQWRRNKWLVLAFFSFGWTLFNLQGSLHRFGFLVHPAFNNPAFVFLSFPAFYFYTKNLVGLKTIREWKNWWHFVPILLLHFLFMFFPIPAPEQLVKATAWNFQILVFIAASLVIPIAYTWFILRLVRLNQKKYQHEFAESNIFITLNWIKWIVSILTFMLLFSLFGVLFSHFYAIFPVYWITQLPVLLVCATLSYFSFRQPSLYTPTPPVISPKLDTIKKIAPLESNPVENISKYDTLISGDEKNGMITRIEKYMIEKQPYLNPKIRMPELALAIDLSPNVFSYLINDHYQMNFFAFINQHRIEYAKKLLKDKDHQLYTLETISQMAGFNSKSSFYRRFKEVVGKSPGAFQKELG